MIVPAGWTATENRAGFSLLRNVPYGGGYPILNARSIDASEAAALRFDGDAARSPAGPVQYRYERWTNPRGRGYRLEVLADLEGRTVLIEASVWDPAMRIDKAMFEREFWPIVHSLAGAPRAP